MTKYAAFGTELRKGATEIAQVASISGPGLALDTEDVTSHDSEDGWEEVVGTILRSGEVSLDLVFDPAEATQVALWTDMVSRAANTYSLVFPDAANTTWTFDALVTAFEPDEPHDGALTASATLKITGKPTLA
jgi:predicted secreted protein